MAAKETSFKILMLPWLAHGHISPNLELAKKLFKRNFQIYFCSTPINLCSIKKSFSQITNSSELQFEIQLVEFHLPSLPQLPPHYYTTHGLPPHLMSTLVKALEIARPAFSDILESHKPHLIMYDVNFAWAMEMEMSHNIPALHFHITGDTAKAFFLRTFKHRGRQFPFASIFLKSYEISKLRHVESSSNHG
ncbi:hypothetical protein RND71_001868 [Anisodus tanguticus]|uniref:Glycosyltransferase N-terminal domain-containing protein n=1 Tax=Anisodus tanguticus TaxID=243964 RepID=A0AAE1VW56_9SOLA|nr:hypothetical protein RND71_001868 [Anisodus tanguticus]